MLGQGIDMLAEAESTSRVQNTGHGRADLIVGRSPIFVSLCSPALAARRDLTMERLVEADSGPPPADPERGVLPT